jgi:hypothetical protein
VRIERTERGDLVVTNRETFIRVLLVGCIAVIVLVWLAPVRRKEAIAWSAIALIFGVALVAADERSRFVFDRERDVLTWRKDTAFRHVAGEIPFSAITALSLERDFAASGQRGNARRLVLLTREGPIPVTSAFSGMDRTQEPTGRAIQQFLIERRSGQDLPFHTS